VSGRGLAAATAPARRKSTLLYVEDNRSNVRLIERVLAVKRAEVTLLVASGGELGLELARSHPPDAVLLDLNLPDIPGEDVLRELRADPRTRDLPVAIVSADAMPDQIERLRAVGVRAYLTKPFDLARLIAVVDELLANGPREAP